MKNLSLKNTGFEHLEKAFKEWLDILGYCEMSVYNMPNIVREFLHYLEQQGVSQINKLEQKHYKGYLNHISTRKNERRGGALSIKYLNMHIHVLEKFHAFLSHKGVKNLADISLKQLKLSESIITVLTQSEVQTLYKITDIEGGSEKQGAFNARDRVMLTVCYSCGLRRTEAANLTLGDINFDTRILHVRKGKNYKERFVPFNKLSAKYLQDWIYNHRLSLLKDRRNGSLFIGCRGKSMGGGGLYQRLKLLQLKLDDTTLQNKSIGLHTLRHSIATHLLENGMSLEKISRFLGHSSLTSTEIYTHLINQ